MHKKARTDTLTFLYYTQNKMNGNSKFIDLRPAGYFERRLAYSTFSHVLSGSYVFMFFASLPVLGPRSF